MRVVLELLGSAITEQATDLKMREMRNTNVDYIRVHSRRYMRCLLSIATIKSCGVLHFQPSNVRFPVCMADALHQRGRESISMVLL